MSANCSCGWTGGVGDVLYGGMCPQCFEKVTWSNGPVHKVLAWAAIPNDAEFNRRAAVALNGVDVRNHWEQSIHAAVKIAAKHSRALMPVDQRGLFAHVLRRRSEITDKALIDYAELKARG